ncbi:hypothetical protein AB0935_14300 [Streptomyces sp. NPDC007027]|uniref:amino acid kinase family protein n=1 Tax=unclassified Streptomyces TaxID=2593676 RepID=UPI0033D4D7E4
MTTRRAAHDTPEDVTPGKRAEHRRSSGPGARHGHPVDGPPIVLKFGGSAFSELEGFHRVAQYAARRLADERRPLVLIVSAMSGTTGRLQQTLDALVDDPPADTAAMLLTTGETVSVALLAAALNAEGVPAHPLQAAGTGFVAEGPSDRACLVEASAEPLTAALADCPVVVVPGGQAVDAAGRTVMLGRNSSDLSAVAAAAALGAETCELFSDVPGVCTADPYLVPAARVLDRIDYESLRRMSRYGAKVVHESAVDWAERGGVRLLCRPFPWSESAGEGTEVGTGPGAAAVVVLQNSDVWCFRSAHQRGAAAEQLRGEGLVVTEFDTAGTACLTVPAGARGSTDHLRSAHRMDGICLVTALGWDSGAEHSVVPRAEAAEEARRCHAELYPRTGGDAPREAATPVFKARSAHSDVLVGIRRREPQHPDARGEQATRADGGNVCPQ